MITVRDQQRKKELLRRIHRKPNSSIEDSKPTALFKARIHRYTPLALLRANTVSPQGSRYSSTCPFRRVSRLGSHTGTPVPTTPLTQLTPDAGATIIQQEAVTVYNSVNKKVKDVIDFLHEALFAYEKGGLRCVQFLKKELNLDFVSGNTLGMTRHDTSTGIFSRYVNHVTSDVHISYFSYHKPIVTVINNDITFDEINNVQDDFNINDNQLSL
ncbi:hypothetical protein PV328_007728 [Microctonus aethiopoides]|uniref:Uncharacterized protein n=1 Tax=Microctonus aethiopoides TaxID=144406 RepID=A0AA39C9C7_9HYME|nr:hypothetical protein PV328_007728 [Microctonus aethiopoides]